MSTKMLLTARLDQRMAMNQQLTQAITLLQYNSLDLKQLVQQYMETNPLFEVDDSNNTESLDSDEVYSISSADHEETTHYLKHAQQAAKGNQFQGDDNTFENYSIPETLRNHLMQQTLMCRFSPDQQMIAEAIIDAIDENGHLTMSLEEIQSAHATLSNINLAKYQEVLAIIKTFDPIGIAAANAHESLILQLEALHNKDLVWNISHDILKKYFDLLSFNNTKLIKRLGISDELFAAALNLIRTLNPKPGLLFHNEMNIAVEPELYVKKIRNTWRVFLTDSILTNVKINNKYLELIKEHKKHDSYEAMHKELQEAQWLLKGLKRRNDTLLDVATHIIKLQYNFIEYGHAFMKPMNIIDVAQALELHESTVSRVTTGKYIATPRGIFELKYFFPSYVLTQSGDTCSDTAVKELIKEILSQETVEKTFSDGEISKLLKEKGIKIARRTVAKYRDAMKILSSYQRAQINSRSSKTEN